MQPSLFSSPPSHPLSRYFPRRTAALSPPLSSSPYSPLSFFSPRPAARGPRPCFLVYSSSPIACPRRFLPFFSMDYCKRFCIPTSSASLLSGARLGVQAVASLGLEKCGLGRALYLNNNAALYCRPSVVCDTLAPIISFTALHTARTLSKTCPLDTGVTCVRSGKRAG